MSFYSLVKGQMFVTLLMKTNFIVADKLPKMLQKNLQSDLKIVSKWFRNNEIIVKSGKLQYMLLGKHKP